MRFSILISFVLLQSCYNSTIQGSLDYTLKCPVITDSKGSSYANFNYRCGRFRSHMTERLLSEGILLLAWIISSLAIVKTLPRFSLTQDSA